MVKRSPYKLQVAGLVQVTRLTEVTGLPSQRLRPWEVAGRLVERVDVPGYCPPLAGLLGQDSHLRQKNHIGKH